MTMTDRTHSSGHREAALASAVKAFLEATQNFFDPEILDARAVGELALEIDEANGGERD